MSTDETTDLQPNDRAHVPPGYRNVENHNLVGQWIHERTGLAAELYRFARPTQMHDPLTSTIDYYEFRLVIRPDGPGTPGECVDRTTEPDHAPEMATEWLRAHPDGQVADLEAEALEDWER